ncbi:MAG: radical SAM protein [Bacteroidales bacterium]|nr:radical SAM protein [Bacteroidales bacterium]
MKQQPFNSQESRNILSLSKKVRLRREYFGGLAFNTGNGDIVELDKEAFTLLSLLEKGNMYKKELNDILVENKLMRPNNDDFKHVLSSLEQAGLICQRNHTDSNIFHEPSEKLSEINSLMKNPPRQWLSVPETVHWAVTYRCRQDCPECYTRRFTQDRDELTVNNTFKVIDKLAGWGIFQLAIGGGEPFEKEGLPEIVTYAAQSGLVVHVTTGLKNLEFNDISQYSGKIKNLQIGFSSGELYGGAFTDLKGSLENTISALKDTGISPGVNITLSKQVIRHLEEILVNVLSSGCNRIIFIRYKPPDSRNLWKQEKPDREQLLYLHNTLISIRKKYPELYLRTDCALSFLQRYVPDNLARYAGYKGCVAADRILAISPSGDMYPCSQLVSPEMKAGNIITDDLQDVWDNSGIMKKYRYFRNGRNTMDSWCGICTRKDTCGGCRVFAHNPPRGGDPGCPDPLPPPLKQLGKYGRCLDTREYLEKTGTITAREYMVRYGVEERKAIKELNAITGSDNRSPKIGYTLPRDDIISDIQDSIGYTSGGVPLASYEEIGEWLEEEADDYPQWILNHKRNT